MLCTFNNSLLASHKIFDRSQDNNLSANKANLRDLIGKTGQVILLKLNSNPAGVTVWKLQMRVKMRDFGPVWLRNLADDLGKQ